MNPITTDPLAIPPDVARKLLAIRDELVKYPHSLKSDEAFHQLYSIADPSFSSYDPWAALEAVVEQECANRLDSMTILLNAATIALGNALLDLSR